jgi:hypothetical protein
VVVVVVLVFRSTTSPLDEHHSPGSPFNPMSEHLKKNNYPKTGIARIIIEKPSGKIVEPSLARRRLDVLQCIAAGSTSSNSNFGEGRKHDQGDPLQGGEAKRIVLSASVDGR